MEDEGLVRSSGPRGGMAITLARKLVSTEAQIGSATADWVNRNDMNVWPIFRVVFGDLLPGVEFNHSGFQIEHPDSPPHIKAPF